MNNGNETNCLYCDLQAVVFMVVTVPTEGISIVLFFDCVVFYCPGLIGAEGLWTLLISQRLSVTKVWDVIG